MVDAQLPITGRTSLAQKVSTDLRSKDRIEWKASHKRGDVIRFEAGLATDLKQERKLRYDCYPFGLRAALNSTRIGGYELKTHAELGCLKAPAHGDAESRRFFRPCSTQFLNEIKPDYVSGAPKYLESLLHCPSRSLSTISFVMYLFSHHILRQPNLEKDPPEIKPASFIESRPFRALCCFYLSVQS